MVIFYSLPVALSLALTCKIPGASISKVHSNLKFPLKASGIPSKINLPKVYYRQPSLFHLVKRDLNSWLIICSCENVSDF